MDEINTKAEERRKQRKDWALLLSFSCSDVISRSMQDAEGGSPAVSDEEDEEDAEDTEAEEQEAPSAEEPRAAPGKPELEEPEEPKQDAGSLVCFKRSLDKPL